MLRPVFADPTQPRDGCDQPWIAADWRLGWRPAGTGSSELALVGSMKVPEELMPVTAALQSACVRHRDRMAMGPYSPGMLLEIESWF